MIEIEVSIIVPVHNMERFLRRCLESLVNQTFQKIEIVCVNDGSTDGSQAIIDAMSRSHPGLITSLQTANQGAGAARNKGMQRSRGNYITFVDSDDWVDHGWIDTLYQVAAGKQADIVVGDYIAFTDHRQLGSVSTECATKALHLLGPPAPWNKLYKKELFLENGITFPKYIWHQDLATIPKLMVSAKTISHASGSHYHYLHRPGSISRTFKENRIKDHITAVESLYEYYHRNNLLNEFQPELEFIYIRELIGNYMFKYASLHTLMETLRELSRMETAIRRRFPDFAKNLYISNRDVMDSRNYFIGLNLYRASSTAYAAAIQLYAFARRFIPHA